MKDFISDFIMGILWGFDNNVCKAVEVLTMDIFNGPLYNTATKVMDIVKPIALTIAGICFLIEFLRLTIKMDVLKWEYMIMCMAKLVLTKVAIELCVPAFEAIYATTTEWIINTGNATVALVSGSTASKIEEILGSMGFLESLGFASTMLICFLIIWVGGMIIHVMAYARMFEIMIYLSVSPIPCAFLPLEGGGGGRIVKKFFTTFAGVCLQGLFIVISIVLYKSVIQGSINGAVSGDGAAALATIAGNMLLGTLVLLVAVFKSGSWAKGILDAL